MKAEGAKETTKEGTKANGNMNAETKGGMETDKSQHHHRQCRDVGDRGSAGREAHPDRLHHPVGDQIQETTNVNFNISVGAVVPTVGSFPPAPPADRRDLSGMARL